MCIRDRVNSFNDHELVVVLSDIQQIILNSGCNNVWLSGDLNAHFQRRTQFTELVKNHFAELGLYILLDNENQLGTISSVD